MMKSAVEISAEVFTWVGKTGTIAALDFKRLADKRDLPNMIDVLSPSGTKLRFDYMSHTGGPNEYNYRAVYNAEEFRILILT